MCNIGFVFHLHSFPCYIIMLQYFCQEISISKCIVCSLFVWKECLKRWLKSLPKMTKNISKSLFSQDCGSTWLTNCCLLKWWCWHKLLDKVEPLIASLTLLRCWHNTQPNPNLKYFCHNLFFWYFLLSLPLHTFGPSRGGSVCVFLNNSMSSAHH